MFSASVLSYTLKPFRRIPQIFSKILRRNRQKSPQIPSGPGYNFRKRATKPLLKQKHRQKHLIWAKEKKNWTVTQGSKVLFSDESKFCISFGNQGPRVWRKSGEAQNPCCLKSSVKFPQSVMVWGAMSSAGVGHSVFSEVHSQRSHLPGHFRALQLTSFMEMLISFSSRTWHLPRLPKVPKAPMVQ